MRQLLRKKSTWRLALAALFFLESATASSAIRSLTVSYKPAPVLPAKTILKVALKSVTSHDSHARQMVIMPNVTDIRLAYAPVFDQTAVIDQDTKQLNLAILEKAQAVVDANRFNPANYVPYKSLSTNDNSSQVTSKILSKTMQTIVNQEIANNSLLNLPIIKTASYMKAVKQKNYKLTYGIYNTLAETEIKIHHSVTAKLSYNIASPEVKFGFNWSF